MEKVTLLVVFDPTTENQPALARAGKLLAARKACVHLFGAIYEELDPALNQSSEIQARLDAHRERMRAAAEPLIGDNIRLELEVEWAEDWYDAVLRASRRVAPGAVFKATFSHTPRSRALSRTSDWTLLRESGLPLLLARDGFERDTPTVLAAVDLQSPKRSYQALNAQVIEFAQNVLDVGIAEVHFVNAYRDARLAPERADMIEATGVDAAHIHIHRGEPEEVIVQKARAINASLVVMGHSARTGLTAALAGNTVEKVLDQLECDVLSMPLIAD
ncbi:MAG: universal stress protein [Pseudomonadota bacterium]